MVLRNYIELIVGQPATLHLTDHQIITKMIRDPVLGREKPVNALVFSVDQLDGQPVSALWSVTSEKLASQLQPFLEGKRYQRYSFTLTRRGEGFTTSYTVEPRLLGGQAPGR